jgi:hypothetical protein
MKKCKRSGGIRTPIFLAYIRDFDIHLENDLAMVDDGSLFRERGLVNEIEACGSNSSELSLHRRGRGIIGVSWLNENQLSD